MSESDNQARHTYHWGTTPGPLPQGWYWWRADESDDAPEIVYSSGQTNVAIEVSDQEYVARESHDWTGEWNGPIIPPANEKK